MNSDFLKSPIARLRPLSREARGRWRARQLGVSAGLGSPIYFVFEAHASNLRECEFESLYLELLAVVVLPLMINPLTIIRSHGQIGKVAAQVGRLS